MVDWKKIQPNFFVVFPEGVLGDVPYLVAAVTRVESKEDAVKLQNISVKRFPNVSIVDLRSVMKAINTIMGKIAYAIEFMAYFTIVIGIISFV